MKTKHKVLGEILMKSIMAGIYFILGFYFGLEVNPPPTHIIHWVLLFGIAFFASAFGTILFETYTKKNEK